MKKEKNIKKPLKIFNNPKKTIAKIGGGDAAKRAKNFFRRYAGGTNE